MYSVRRPVLLCQVPGLCLQYSIPWPLLPSSPSSSSLFFHSVLSAFPPSLLSFLLLLFLPPPSSSASTSLHLPSSPLSNGLRQFLTGSVLLNIPVPFLCTHLHNFTVNSRKDKNIGNSPVWSLKERNHMWILFYQLNSAFISLCLVCIMSYVFSICLRHLS